VNRTWRPSERRHAVHGYRGLMPDVPEAVPAPDLGDPELHKTIVRLASGGIGEGIDRLRELAAELESADEDPESVSVVPLTTSQAAMVLVGWLSEWPEQVEAIRTTTQDMTYPLGRFFSVVYDTSAALLEATGIAGLVSSLTEPSRVALAEELERLAHVGTAEYARGRVLSVHAFERSIDGIVGYLGASEEVGELVREQTLGITGAAVQEIRETGAAADGLTEGMFRRLLGRERRPLPPAPAVE
jgi:hypothetical protein